MTKRANRIVIGVFLAFLAAFFAANLIAPDKKFSQQENRMLQQAPAFSLRALFSGSFTSDFEAYTTDQFVLRDDWTTLKARCELLTGKKENNGVYYCGGDTLIERFAAPSDDVIETNVASLNQLVENSAAPVYFGLIPGAAQIERDKLPKNAPSDSEDEVIAEAYALSEAENIDISSALAAHAREDVFYRTDHHWTSLGACYGCQALCGALGLPCSGPGDYAPQTVSDAFYGTVYSKSGFSWVKPDSIQIFVPDDGSAAVTRYSADEPAAGKLYDESYLSQKDKYSLFLGGNVPRLTIETGGGDGLKLLIIRDSFTDSLAPFLLKSVSRMDLLDLRYYRGSVADYIAEGDFDAVIVLYSVDTFCTDTNLFLLGM